MTNPIQQTLRQASQSVPGQRAFRFPWQKPTLGEHAAETLDALADSSATAPDRIAALNDRLTRQAQEAKRSTGASLADARGRAQQQIKDAQSYIQERADVARAQTADQLGDLREMARGRARFLRRRAGEVGAAAAQAATRAQPKVADQMNGAGTQTAGTVTTLGGVDLAADERAARSADRAEWASRQAIDASNHIADALNRVLQARGQAAPNMAIEEETPNDIEIRVNEAAESPLMRAADAVARVLAATGGAIYDYSGGQYGLEPVNAKELRRERQKEKRSARPVAIIEGHYTGDKAITPEKQGSRLPLLLMLGAGIAAVGVAYSQRGQLRPLLDRVMSQLQGRRIATLPEPRVMNVPARPPTPTPSFNRIVSGQLLDSASSTSAVSAGRPATTGTVTPGSSAASTSSASANDGTARTYTAGDQAQPR